MANTKEQARVDIHNQLTKWILLINGVSAISLLSFMETAIEISKTLAIASAFSIGVYALAAAFVMTIEYFREVTSRAFSGGHKKKQTYAFLTRVLMRMPIILFMISSVSFSYFLIAEISEI